MMKWFCNLLCIFYYFKTVAQKELNYYTEVHENKLSVRTSLYRNHFNLNTISKKGNYTYAPLNNSISLGFGVSHPKLPFEVGYGFTFNKNHPKTKITDLQLHKYGKHYVLDLFFKDYNGFYKYGVNLPSQNHPNLSMFTLGLVGQYVFNGEKFSYKSTFGGKEKQLKSAGSLLVGGQAYYLNSNSDKITTDDIKTSQFGVLVGYAHNFVLLKNWSANLSINGGLNLTPKLSIKSSILFRGSILYAGENFTSGLFLVGNTINSSNNEKILDSLSFAKLSFDFIYHFNLQKNKK